MSDECPICFDATADPSNNEVCSVCRSVYHTSCMQKWLEMHRCSDRCPVCRTGVMSCIEATEKSISVRDALLCLWVVACTLSVDGVDDDVDGQD